MRNYDRALSGLKELHATHTFDKVKTEHLENLIMICIEPKGEVLHLWDSFKQLAIYSQNIVNSLLMTVPFELLQGKLTKIDLSHCCEQLITGNNII